MKKILFLGAVLGFVAMGCSDGKQRDYAAEAAKAYYDSLIVGGYGYYVDGFGRSDSIPPSYREQLLVNVKQYLHGIRETHRGVNEVRIVSSKVDSVTRTTNVFLMLCFGDSVNEEIVVPMIEKNGTWYMK
ncbi:MAG: hypothetical protein ACI4B3_09390 [Prevotella sp.]